jgi:hypothetical protein
MTNVNFSFAKKKKVFLIYPRSPIIGQVSLILDNSYLVGNLTNSKIAETKALEPLKS